MPLSWNEIKSRAIAFSNEWKDEVSEDAEAKSFWDDFFNVFGISRRRVATFEQQVKKVDDTTGYIDLLWKGVILVEHKSRGKSLDRAYRQAKDYFPGLKEKELPRYILVSDFEHFRLYDLESSEQTDFTLAHLVDHVHLFGFIAGYEKRTYKEQDPVNIEAAELMGRLHDQLKAIGYTGHHLELYLVRLVFILFADDSIFEKGIFYDYLDGHTREDGSDLAAHLQQVFEVLNTPEERRLKYLDESLRAFPYVNGKLFEEHLPVAAFDSQMRRTLMECCLLDWGKISPAIFGSLFQSVMDEKARRNLGAHYTSEKNILKLIKPLFLDELWAEYHSAKNDKRRLKALHDKISHLRILDPACGCGNFLIVAYRELRLLEIEIVRGLLKEQLEARQRLTDIDIFFTVDVDRFYGIEYEEFPAQIAQVAMWLMDHQMNQKASEVFGEYYVRLPLKKSATIRHGNALRLDWQSLIEPLPWEKEEARFDYILGNPPFIGHHLQTIDQKKDLHFVLRNIQAAGVMDYVSAWYYKAAEYLKEFSTDASRKPLGTKVGFVSTNSITQGEQVGILWSVLLNDFQIKIHFAHRTFKWTNEARGVAVVYCVVIGFSNFNIDHKKLYEYEDIKGEPHEVSVKNINPYLVDAKDILVHNRTKPYCKIPEMVYGSKPTDGGHYLLTTEEKELLISRDKNAAKFIKPFIGAKEFLNGEKRWCIWLKDAAPNEIKESPEILKRVEAVKKFRSESVAASTKNYKFHTLFRQVTQPNTDYILVPRHTSENRQYIPFGFFDKGHIVGDSCFSVANATLYHFGIMTSLMHMAWVKYTCGRIKSDYRYSKDIVYNNFPWPKDPSEKQIQSVEAAAQAVLDARAQYPGASLADLYDPATMPPALVKAHQALDKAVDLCYRPQPFPNETKRIEFLFELYDQYTAGLFAEEKKKKGRGKKEVV